MELHSEGYIRSLDTFLLNDVNFLDFTNEFYLGKYTSVSLATGTFSILEPVERTTLLGPAFMTFVFYIDDVYSGFFQIILENSHTTITQTVNAFVSALESQGTISGLYSIEVENTNDIRITSKFAGSYANLKINLWQAQNILNLGSFISHGTKFGVPINIKGGLSGGETILFLGDSDNYLF